MAILSSVAHDARNAHQSLIPVRQDVIGGEKIQTVNARDLHVFLEVSTRFNDWIVSRIDTYNFIENKDFMIFTENSVKGRPSKEYAISLDMAKELCMVERNEKGKEARQYFIECERKAKITVTNFPNPKVQALLARESRLAMATFKSLFKEGG